MCPRHAADKHGIGAAVGNLRACAARGVAWAPCEAPGQAEPVAWGETGLAVQALRGTGLLVTWCGRVGPPCTCATHVQLDAHQACEPANVWGRASHASRQTGRQLAPCQKRLLDIECTHPLYGHAGRFPLGQPRAVPSGCGACWVMQVRYGREAEPLSAHTWIVRCLKWNLNLQQGSTACTALLHEPCLRHWCGCSSLLPA